MLQMLKLNSGLVGLMLLAAIITVVNGSIPIEEIQIETRTGIIAAQWWRPKSSQPNDVPIILCHGWQDNAQSFATLIPLLPQQFSYLAIDFPGHGLSSHLQSGYDYHFIDMVSILEQIRRKFQWKKLSFVGHSMGAVICFLYASTFVDNVNMIVTLDTLKPLALDPKIQAKLHRFRTLKSFQTMERSADPTQTSPEYTKDEIIERVLEGSLNSINRDKVEYLLTRGCRESTQQADKFIINRDIRTKYMHPQYLDQGTSLELMKNIKVPYFYIKGNDNEFTDPPHILNEAIEEFTKFNSKFEMMKVNGTHHFHLNNPELISKRLSVFLQKYHPLGRHPSSKKKLSPRL